MSLSLYSLASRRNHSKTIPNFVLVKIQLQLLGIILRQFEGLSYPKFNSISSEFFQDSSEICRSRISITPHRKFSKTIPNCLLAEVQLHLIEIILRQFQVVS